MAELFTTSWVTIQGMDTGAYASGDAIGIGFSLTVPEQGILEKVLITDLAGAESVIDVVLFNESFVGATNNSAFDMTDSDRRKLVGYSTVSSYASFNDNSLGQATSLSLDYDLQGVETIRGQLVSRGTPTYAVGDLLVQFTIIPYSSL